MFWWDHTNECSLHGRNFLHRLVLLLKTQWKISKGWHSASYVKAKALEGLLQDIIKDLIKPSPTVNGTAEKDLGVKFPEELQQCVRCDTRCKCGDKWSGEEILNGLNEQHCLCGVKLRQSHGESSYLWESPTSFAPCSISFKVYETNSIFLFVCLVWFVCFLFF